MINTLKIFSIIYFFTIIFAKANFSDESYLNYTGQERVDRYYYRTTPGFIGNGFPGKILEYESDNELDNYLNKYNLRAFWFVRDKWDESKFRMYENFKIDRLPFLFYKPKNKNEKNFPMIIYIGGTGEYGTDLLKMFRQSGLYNTVCSEEFQNKYPCYVFSPMLPIGSEKRILGVGNKPREIVRLVCDAMYGVIKDLGGNNVDTNRLYIAGLSSGGTFAFLAQEAYPNRFAACVATSTNLIKPQFLSKNGAGHLWVLHNEYAINSERIKADIEAVSQIKKETGYDYITSFFPNRGHNSWDMAWNEDNVWKWVFSKSSQKRNKGYYAGNYLQKKVNNRIFINNAKCTASKNGIGDKHMPKHGADNLNSTCYISKEPMSRGDWWMVEFEKPIKGEFCIISGNNEDDFKILNGHVDVSSDGRIWKRVGFFINSSGKCKFRLSTSIKFLRIIYSSSKKSIIAIKNVEVYE